MDYFIFVLGYDLLHDKLNGIPCDVAYQICASIYKDFVKSEYNELPHSEYECLSKYIDAHLDEINDRLERLK